MNSNENPLCVSLWSEKFQQNSISVQTFFRLKNTLKKNQKYIKRVWNVFISVPNGMCGALIYVNDCVHVHVFITENAYKHEYIYITV